MLSGILYGLNPGRFLRPRPSPLLARPNVKAVTTMLPGTSSDSVTTTDSMLLGALVKGMNWEGLQQMLDCHPDLDGISRQNTFMHWAPLFSKRWAEGRHEREHAGAAILENIYTYMGSRSIDLSVGNMHGNTPAHICAQHYEGANLQRLLTCLATYADITKPNDSGDVPKVPFTYADVVKHNALTCSLDPGPRRTGTVDARPTLASLVAADLPAHTKNPRLTLDFAHLLSGVINPSVNAAGFDMACMLKIFDHDRGVSGFAGSSGELVEQRDFEDADLEVLKKLVGLA